jgi:hypothetical protein
VKVIGKVKVVVVRVEWVKGGGRIGGGVVEGVCVCNVDCRMQSI